MIFAHTTIASTPTVIRIGQKKKLGELRESNPWPLAPEARIIPLDQVPDNQKLAGTFPLNLQMTSQSFGAFLARKSLGTTERTTDWTRSGGEEDAAGDAEAHAASQRQPKSCKQPTDATIRGICRGTCTRCVGDLRRPSWLHLDVRAPTIASSGLNNRQTRNSSADALCLDARA